MDMRKWTGIKKVHIASFLLVAALLTGCGSSETVASKATADEYAYAERSAAAGGVYENSYDSYAMEEAEMTADYDSAATPEAEHKEVSVEEGSAQNRKLITTVNLSAETDDLDVFNGHLEEKVRELGGYIESSNVHRNDYGDSRKSADYTIRIPAAKLEEFLSDVEGGANVLDRSVNTQDITLHYADTESHERALKVEEDRLFKIMEQADEVEDLIALEERLTEVRYELDSIRSQLRTYDDQIDYSTVYLNVSQVKEYTEPPEQTPAQRIQYGFFKSLESVLTGLMNFGIWFVIHIPQLVLICIILAIFILFIRFLISKSVRKPKEKGKKKGKNAQAVDKAGAEGEKPSEDVAAPANNDVPNNSDGNGAAEKETAQGSSEATDGK
ncbi:MAG: DUF4349 domain-containing protein [Lachnospiraceae bacterium]|nr:DUF4349 domain-containing protein [Lachnospiraceae bacterium]